MFRPWLNLLSVLGAARIIATAGHLSPAGDGLAAVRAVFCLRYGLVVLLLTPVLFTRRETTLRRLLAVGAVGFAFGALLGMVRTLGLDDVARGSAGLYLALRPAWLPTFGLAAGLAALGSRPRPAWRPLIAGPLGGGIAWAGLRVSGLSGDLPSATAVLLLAATAWSITTGLAAIGRRPGPAA